MSEQPIRPISYDAASFNDGDDLGFHESSDHVDSLAETKARQAETPRAKTELETKVDAEAFIGQVGVTLRWTRRDEGDRNWDLKDAA